MPGAVLRYSLLILAATLTAASVTTHDISDQKNRQSFIISSSSLANARARVDAVGGLITHELAIIDAIAATLDARQLRVLRKSKDLKFFADATVEVNGHEAHDAAHVELIGAEHLHAKGLYGDGVTVAILDTGIWNTNNHLRNDLHGLRRILAEYDAQYDWLKKAADEHGHGTHLASVIASSKKSDLDTAQGIAPNAKLVNVKAFGEDGSGSYADVIRGLGWLLDNKKKYGIRVLNLSFSATPQSHYWDDPINQAVMKVWEAGIVVVASAGNNGPDAMSIGVPANLPYVITVGAMTDSYTPKDPSDDRLTTFSAAGPTFEGFVKPEIIAPGGHILGLMQYGRHEVTFEHPEGALSKREYEMSGTSQAAAVVSGTVALMLQAEPWLTPDQAKCKLMSTARPGVVGGGKFAYSVFQQGAGLINAADAVRGTHFACANYGLDIAADVAGDSHFMGPARQDDDGNYYILGADRYEWDGIYQSYDGLDGVGMLWNDGTPENAGMLWNDGDPSNSGMLWNDGTPWTVGMLWNDSDPWNVGMLWNDGDPSSVGMLWNDGWSGKKPSETPVTVNRWVDPE